MVVRSSLCEGQKVEDSPAMSHSETCGLKMEAIGTMEVTR